MLLNQTVHLFELGTKFGVQEWLETPSIRGEVLATAGKCLQLRGWRTPTVERTMSSDMAGTGLVLTRSESQVRRKFVSHSD